MRPIVALRGILDTHPGDLVFAAAALGLSAVTVMALHRQLPITAVVDDENEFAIPDPGHTARALVEEAQRRLRAVLA